MRPPRRIAPTARLSDAEVPSLDDVTTWPGQAVDVAGQQIFVRATPSDDAQAQPALFVHGLGGSSLNWTDFAGLLRGKLDIESIDLPGFGRSGPANDGDYSPEAHARTVIRYLELSGRGPVHLAGNSMGGMISIIVASRRPDLVRTLTLIAPAVPDIKIGRLHPLRHDWRMALLVVPVLGLVALRKLGAAPVESRVRGTIAVCFADPSRFPQRRFDEAVEEARARAAYPWIDEAMLRSTRALVRSQLVRRQSWAQLRTVSVPTLVLWGDEDKLVAPDLAAHVAGAIPDSRMLMLEHIGHTPMMEDPVSSARAVLALLEDTAARSSAPN